MGKQRRKAKREKERNKTQRKIRNILRERKKVEGKGNKEE